MIAFARVSARYRKSDRDALSDVELEAPRGRVTAVVGPNGSGKSTLVRLLLRRAPLTRGEVLLDGTPLAATARQDLARRVAVVMQREDLAFPVTVVEYVTLGRFPHLGGWRAPSEADRLAVARAIARAGVEPLSGRSIDQLSGGEWQRVRLARALAQSGKALVLDEPSTFLDVAHEMAVFELLHELATEGVAILLVSHQLNLVARFADWMVLLHAGRVVAAGPPDDVMRGPVLERVYEWPLVITRDPAIGAPALVPLRSRRANVHPAP